MKFTGDKYLDYYIQKTRTELIWYLIGSALVFPLIVAGFYYKTDSATMLIVNITIVLLFFVFLVRSLIVSAGRSINTIVSDVEISEKIILTTYPYRFLFYKVDAAVFTLTRDSLKIEETKFPYNASNLPKTKTWRLETDASEIYVVYESFPDELKAEFMILNT
ncbi:hypothetical protein AAFN85_13140 [Mucilaginibacter sp. CAU 1740]|uniref:hypothetical protein n=1 Tax=Mucilaginibacter sp. CAU 1740 TaxID=3140365 RepID=UPI00325A9069